MVLSIGVFFTLMIFGLQSYLPHALLAGLTHQHVPFQVAKGISVLPPVSLLFAAFLGYNPIAKLIGASTLGKLPSKNSHYLTGRFYFPHLISHPFGHGLAEAFIFAAIACLIAAVASWLRGGKYTASDIDPGSPSDEEYERDLRAPTPSTDAAVPTASRTQGLDPSDRRLTSD
jgi:hypothetical protein